MQIDGGVQGGADAGTGRIVLGHGDFRRQMIGVQVLDGFVEMIVVVGERTGDVGSGSKKDQSYPMAAAFFQGPDQVGEGRLGPFEPAGLFREHASTQVEDDDQVAGPEPQRCSSRGPIVVRLRPR